MKKTIAIVISVLVVVCLFLAWVFGLFANHVKIACSIADLAPLPKNVKVLRSGGWSIGFSDRSCFVFKATRKEIDDWIRKSPSLKNNKPDVLTNNHRLISFDSTDELEKYKRKHPNQWFVDTLNGYEYVQQARKTPKHSPSVIHYYNIPTDPSWFKPDISRGRFFNISKNYCCVFVDDANNVVWVTASRS